jgi:hypothetical protein
LPCRPKLNFEALPLSSRRGKIGDETELVPPAYLSWATDAVALQQGELRKLAFDFGKADSDSEETDLFTGPIESFFE